MKKVIVTGANGFVGSAVVQELLKNNIEVIALVHSVQKREFGASPLLKLVPFDLEQASDLPEIIKDRDVDTFYHFAWNGGHALDRNNTQLQLQNVQWSVDCLRAAKKIGCSRFIGVGTIMEFETYYTSNSQENRPGMGYIYGASKLTAHAMCKSVAADIGIDLVWAMLINTYGVGEKSPRLINRTIKNILESSNPIDFTPGLQNYDFVYIDDTAKAFYLLGRHGKPFKNYMVGSGAAKPLKEFIIEMQQAIAPEREFRFGVVPYTGTDIPLSVFSIDELKNDTGYQPKISFAKGVVKTKKWLENLQ